MYITFLLRSVRYEFLLGTICFTYLCYDILIFFLKYGKNGFCISSEFLQKHLSDSYNKSSKFVWKFNFGNVLNVLEECSTLLT
jgi:hypothetical protein